MWLEADRKAMGLILREVKTEVTQRLQDLCSGPFPAVRVALERVKGDSPAAQDLMTECDAVDGTGVST